VDNLKSNKRWAAQCSNSLCLSCLSMPQSWKRFTPVRTSNLLEEEIAPYNDGQSCVARLPASNEMLAKAESPRPASAALELSCCREKPLRGARKPCKKRCWALRHFDVQADRAWCLHEGPDSSEMKTGEGKKPLGGPPWPPTSTPHGRRGATCAP